AAVQKGAVAGSKIADAALRPVAFHGKMLAGKIRVFADGVVGFSCATEANDGACAHLYLSTCDGSRDRLQND
ncbi:MAG TPA: hypothetical protein VGM98_23990, partial [Schlesneria sp.]